MKNLNDSMKYFNKEEIIDDYRCSECNEKHQL